MTPQPEQSCEASKVSPRQPGLEWDYDLFDVVPKWTIEPDISAVMAIAKLHLPSSVEYDATTFAAGAFNKLFLLSPSKVPSSPSYIMRVTLPVDPYFKTASEVATLEFLSQHTSIPVPFVIAYDTSSENELGFEWILMTRLPGVPLKELWSSPQLLWGEKVNIIETISGYIQQMQTLHFGKMGNLYLSGQRHPPLHWARTSARNDRQDFVPLQAYPQFVIGPVVAISFFYGNRIKLPSDRGPFSTSSEWISSLLNLQVASTEDLKAKLPRDEDEGNPYDSDDILELDDAIQAASDLLSLVPEFFADTNEGFVLCHDDLSTNNIIIDPVTHLITGVVDWECVSLQPVWKARRPPQLLYGPEIDAKFYEMNFGGPVPDLPLPYSAGPEEEEDSIRSDLRQYLEQMILRRNFDGIIPPDGRPEKLKRIFENKVAKCDVNGAQVVKWVQRVKKGESPERKETGGDDLYFWPED